MAWAEKLAGGYRGRYRDQHGTKQKVVQPDGSLFPRERDAIDAAEDERSRQRRRAVIDGAATRSASMTWGEWWDQLAESRAFADTDTAATEHYVVERYLRPQWGDVPLNKITFGEVDKWLTEGDLRVRKGMSPSYVHRIFSVFHVSIKAAMRKGILTASPCAGVQLPKRQKRAKPYLAQSSAAAMAEHLRPDYRDAIEFDLETGLRPGELCGLHADRLDLERGWMLVAEVFVKRRHAIRPFPKDKDARMVPLTDRAIEIVKRRLDGRDVSAGCGVPHTDDSPCHSPLVFLTVRGNAMHPDTLGWHMKNAAQKAQVSHRSPYAGRRGWATRAAEGGLDAFQLAEILGHSTLTQAQEYVQQTPAARMKLATALQRYPQLTVVDGGVGQRGAARGARPDRQASSDIDIEGGENVG